MLFRMKGAANTKALQLAATVAFALLVYFILPSSLLEPARRQSFIFVIAALFWALEIIPLYATSILVITMEIFLLCRPGGVLNMGPTGYTAFLVPFGSPVIILFFGGFILAQAMRKYALDQIIALKMLQVFGQKRFNLMLGFMFATAFLSMWMSNTATTAMMVAMVFPLLKQLDPSDGFRTALVLAIPFAANIGGMATPIGTPPNAIAIGMLAERGIFLGFVGWMKMAVPLVIILLFFVAFLLYVSFPQKKGPLNLQLTLNQPIGRRSFHAAAIVALTVLLWLTSEFHKIPSSVIALLAAGLLATSGLLDRDDFKVIDWDVLILMWGGLALGEGMEMSGLTKWIVELPLFQQHGIYLVVVFCLLAIIVSTFMSNTATANLLIPVVMVIPGESKVLLATMVALSCSLAMAMPISTPPNAIAFSTNMIKSRDMLKTGVVVSLVSLLIILVGFKLVITKAFGLE